MERREAIKVMGAGVLSVGGLSTGYAVPAPLLERFLRSFAEAPYQERFFSARSLETVRVLADMIIPRDGRSGSATEAGTVEFMDFMLSESDEDVQEQWRAGLAWLDAEVWQRFGVARFVDATEAQRGEVLDMVAWPERAEPRHAEQVVWFNRVRDLVGSGFFSSRMGVDDLGYVGGVVNPVWEGAPEEALDELGLSYDAWDRRYEEGA